MSGFAMGLLIGAGYTAFAIPLAIAVGKALKARQGDEESSTRPLIDLQRDGQTAGYGRRPIFRGEP